MKINNKQKNKIGSRFIRSYSICLKRSPEQSNGFTLIELMVATSIFITIMLAAMGALFMLLDAAKSSRALRSAMDNVNFSMESMTRSIRMGTNYTCATGENNGIHMTDNQSATQDCPDGGNFMAFIPQTPINSNSAIRVGYMLSEKTKENIGTGKYTLKRCEGAICVPIVSDDVNIDNLKFFVKGSIPANNIQPSVYIMMKGTVTLKGVATSFSLQTMASQRNY